jgi:hypothetical protein
MSDSLHWRAACVSELDQSALAGEPGKHYY